MMNRLLFYIGFCIICFQAIHANNKISDIDLSKFDSKLSGSISDRNITMYISIVGGKVNGLYQYGNNVYYLALEGTISTKGRCLLFERNGKGKITGSFEGKISENEFVGKWQNLDHTKILNFNLVKVSGILIPSEATFLANPHPIKTESSNSFGLYVILGILAVFILWYLYRRLFALKGISNVDEKIEIPLNSMESDNINPVEEKSPIIEQTETKSSLSESEQKGIEFEEFIVNKFNSLNRYETPYFTLEHWQSDKGTNGIYPKSNQNPDLVYEFRMGNFKRKFAVECKYRGKKFDIIEIADSAQLWRYKNFAKAENIAVYLVLGLGGIPSNPKEMFSIPLNDINDVHIDYENLSDNYRVSSFFYNKEIDMLNPPKYLMDN